ncbi:MAG: hypothetical protein IPO92_19125 [Saprospiraceae bacterium]|nr:hypothetical protein [Saprospiraceae bacterium]
MDPLDNKFIIVGYRIGIFGSANAGDDWTSVGTHTRKLEHFNLNNVPDIVYVAGATNTTNGLSEICCIFMDPINNPPLPLCRQT